MRFLNKIITPDHRRMIGTTLVYIIIGTIIINWIGIIVFGNSITFSSPLGIHELIMKKIIKKKMEKFEEKLQKILKSRRMREHLNMNRNYKNQTITST